MKYHKTALINDKPAKQDDQQTSLASSWREEQQHTKPQLNY